MSIGRASRALAAAAAAAIVAAAVVAGCDPMSDKNLLRFLGFTDGGSTISVKYGTLTDETTDTVDAEFENATFVVGSSNSAGTGIFVNRAHVEYSMRGASPPSYDYAVSLYLAPPASAGDTTKGTLSKLPIVPDSLKSWMIQNGTEDDFTAHVTFFAETDEGNDLEVEGSIAVELNDGGGGGEKPTVSIEATTPNADQSSKSFGIFTITRLGGTTSDLTVTYALSGDAATDNYDLSPSTIFIPADDRDTTMTVRPTTSPVLTAAVELTVTLTATATSNYTVVGPPATVTIQP